MTDSTKDRAVHSPRKKGSLTPPSGLQFHRKEIQGRSKGSISSVSRVDEPRQRDQISHFTARVENTYQLGPRKHFPMVTVNHVLKNVLTKYLQEEKYEPEICRKMTKMLSEVIKTQVKELMIPRYKLIVVTHIGQLKDQSLFIGSRCLWDPKSDTVSSYIFRNSSLFALASVYAIYFE